MKVLIYRFPGDWQQFNFIAYFYVDFSFVVAIVYFSQLL